METKPKLKIAVVALTIALAFSIVAEESRIAFIVFRHDQLVEDYNERGEDYNELVEDYNELVEKYNNLIEEYNDLVEKYNKIFPFYVHFH